MFQHSQPYGCKWLFRGASPPPLILTGINLIFQFLCWIKFMKYSALWVINVLIVTTSSFPFPINMIAMECAQTARSPYFTSCSPVAEPAQISATPPQPPVPHTSLVCSLLTDLLARLTIAQYYFHPFVGGKPWI